MSIMKISRGDGAKNPIEWSWKASGRSRPGRGPRTRRTTALATGIASTLMVGALSGVATAGATPAAANPTNGRVDLYTPTFSNPLNITNPLFPKGPSKISQTVALGTEPDTKLRFEATQLDQTRTILWNGKNIKTRVTPLEDLKPLRGGNDCIGESSKCTGTVSGGSMLPCSQRERPMNAPLGAMPSTSGSRFSSGTGR